MHKASTTNPAIKSVYITTATEASKEAARIWARFAQGQSSAYTVRWDGKSVVFEEFQGVTRKIIKM